MFEEDNGLLLCASPKGGFDLSIHCTQAQIAALLWRRDE